MWIPWKALTETTWAWIHSVGIIRWWSRWRSYQNRVLTSGLQQIWALIVVCSESWSFQSWSGSWHGRYIFVFSFSFWKWDKSFVRHRNFSKSVGLRTILKAGIPWKSSSCRCLSSFVGKQLSHSGEDFTLVIQTWLGTDCVVWHFNENLYGKHVNRAHLYEISTSR